MIHIKKLIIFDTIVTILSCAFGGAIIFSYFTYAWIGGIIGGIIGLLCVVSGGVATGDITITKDRQKSKKDI